VRFGLALPHYDSSFENGEASWANVKKVAQLAERHGYDSVWISDHLFLDWSKYGGSDDPQGALECWTTMSALAACTSRVRVGSMALCNDFRNPALVAKMAASLDVLSKGRLDVGVGAGWYEPEFRAAGIEYSSPGTRIARLGEAIGIITRLLEGEELTYRGEHYTVTGAVCRPRPVQAPRPPVWVGGKGDFLLRVAARVADGWNFSWLGDIATYRDRSRAADVACERVGRDPTSLRRSVGVYIVSGGDDFDARRRFERLASRTPAGILASDKAGEAISWDDFRQRHFAAGSVGEVIDALGSLTDLGVEEVILCLGALPFQVSDEEDIELIGTQVVSALK
jgi:probable F420-dependent oxidoreductase